MKCVQLLFVCWCSSSLPVTSCISADGYSCLSAYWNTITCVLNITANPLEESNTNYSLKFFQLGRLQRISVCPLVLRNHSYSCVYREGNTNKMNGNKQFNIELCNESGCSSLTKKFVVSQNIQLTPPREVEVQQTPEAFNITWKSGYEDHRYFANYLEYQLLLQEPLGSKALHTREKFELIPRLKLDSYGTCCAKVRSKPYIKEYGATWSQWSPQMCWENDKQGEQENIIVTWTKYLGSLCVVVGVVLFVFYSPAARLKTLSHTPSPAPFFQALFQKHEGNLQEWLSSQGTYALNCTTDDILITDIVSVEPKPVSKDPAEEDQELHPPPGPQLVFSQGPSSYVGLPGLHEVPHPNTTVCPVDTSYTQLPCSVWGLGIAQVQEVSSPPEDFLNSSHGDSGCSCELLSQSPECSLPSSPTTDSPSPCYCTDYCILNKKAEGVVPVFVSK